MINDERRRSGLGEFSAVSRGRQQRKEDTAMVDVRLAVGGKNGNRCRLGCRSPTRVVGKPLGDVSSNPKERSRKSDFAPLNTDIEAKTSSLLPVDFILLCRSCVNC